MGERRGRGREGEGVRGGVEGERREREGEGGEEARREGEESM